MQKLLGFSITLVFISGASASEIPRVDLLAPGFEVQTLPLEITNVNNLVFSPDGQLFALTYDGRVLRLVDSVGDGVEDRVEVYWDEEPFQVPVGMAWSEEGIYVSAHGKVVLLPDENGDGQADREELIASGWPPTDVRSGGVDATGVTLDQEGNLYFALITPNYSNPYRLKDGKARYDLGSERGTVLKLNRDRSRREVVATGLRVPYALRFNREGDLFLTDQEGETWLPGANPLDELHQILPGRHYGFPPRHDEYLPAVFDEPPVVGFGPQHQSTCGLVFNEERQGRRAFGPSAWEGDAFVTGFSRGKLWRVRLLKTRAGYVGAPTLFGISNMMIADVAISPNGDMYLACHSGSPDWGSGPKGQGQIFRVRWVDQASPQVVHAWAAGPFETKIVFDQPVDPILLQDLTSRSIRFGEHVRAGDRLVVHAPPYKAVQAQSQASVGRLRIVSATLEDENQTLRLATDPHPASATFALHLPGFRAATSKLGPAVIDLDYNLNGVEAAWKGVDAEWSGWWPHLDLALTKRLLAGSPALNRLQPLLDRPGTLTLKTALVHHRPTRLRFRSSHSLRILFYEDPIVSKKKDTGIYDAELATNADHQPLPLTLEMALDSETEGKGFSLQVEIAHPPDPTFRPLRLEDLRLPWAPPPLPETSSAVPEVALDLSAGDPVRGESIFFGELARCSTCHAIRGRGADIGPDLSNLVHRDAESVYRDILDPGSVVHPDYLPYIVALKDGRVLTGLLRSEGAELVRLIDSQGEMTTLTRGEIEEFAPGGASIMPTGLLDSFDEADIRDLLAFLLRELEGSNDETKTSPSVSPGEK